MASANLFQQYLQPVKSVTDYAADLDKQEGAQLALHGQRRQNEIAALTADQTRRTMADSMADRNALQRIASTWDANTTADQRVASLRNSGRPALMQQADALEKQALDKKKTDAEAGEKNSKILDESIKRYRTALDFVSTPQDAARWLQAQYNDPGLSEHMNRLAPLDQALSRIPTDPQQFQQWRQQAGMGMEKYAENQRMLAKDAEDARHNKAGEATAAGQLSVARGNLALRGQELDYQKSQPKGQILQSDQGVMLVDQRTGKAAPITAPDGTPLAPKLKDLPTAASAAIMSNAQNINKVQQAIDLLDGKKVGQLSGDSNATGWKGYLPQPVLNRVDPNGVDTRAMITDIGSLVLHDRSGAAVTASETPRLLPFIPLPTDDKDTARRKLVRFKQIYEQEQQAYLDTYSKDQGYKTPKVPVAAPPKQPAMSPEDKQAAAWANANPNDPRAAKIKQQLGL